MLPQACSIGFSSSVQAFGVSSGNPVINITKLLAMSPKGLPLGFKTGSLLLNKSKAISERIVLPVQSDISFRFGRFNFQAIWLIPNPADQTPVITFVIASVI